MFPTDLDEHYCPVPTHMHHFQAHHHGRTDRINTQLTTDTRWEILSVHEEQIEETQKMWNALIETDLLFGMNEEVIVSS